MIRIVLTDEQIQAIAHASEPIDLVDTSGRTLGHMMPATPGKNDLPQGELAEIRRRMASGEEGDSNFSTWGEIKARLQQREEA